MEENLYKDLNDDLDDLEVEYTDDELIDDEFIDSDIDDVEDANEEETEEDFDVIFTVKQNKHKIEGKHRLQRDVIFNGKLETKEENSEYSPSTDFDYFNGFNKDPLDLSISETAYIQKDLEEDVFYILSGNTDLDFNQDRRKPKREDFNDYFKLLTSKLRSKYTHSEIFVCLSYYFTDNIYNMFKILDKKYVSIIIKELKDKGFLKDIGNINFI
jgi:hypothetical protein